MDYRNYDGIFYVRVDKGEEIIEKLLGVCRKEGIRSATFSGIGGCSKAEIQTFIPEKGSFETEAVEGMLELVCITGNVFEDGEDLYHHAHALFSYKVGKEHKTAAGHLKSATVLYTAEIELRPVTGGTIKRKHDSETGTGFWSFE